MNRAGLQAGRGHRGRTIVLIGIVPLVTVGCDSSSRPGREIRLIPAASPYERDIPIPAGFKLVENACEDQSTGTRRLYLRHLYRGDADKYAVRKFYREQMPRGRWALVSDGNIKGEYTIRFEKGTESCTVRIADAESRMKGRTRIQVLIMQEERGQPPSVAQTDR